MSIENNNPLKEKASKKRNKREEPAVQRVKLDTAPVNTMENFKPEAIQYPAGAVMNEQEMLAKRNEATAAVAPAVPTATAPAQTAATKVAPVNFAPAETAKAQNEKGIIPQAQPDTISTMLAGQRAKLVKDKTDAAKMQKYYALTDALGALGKMGGAVIGGAAGGNVLDSMPNVGEYKESRGYLDAFERAKQANEKLRGLDDREFQLRYDKQLRDEQRAYADQKEKRTREYNEQQAKLNREWQMERDRINREWQAAVAEKNFERQAQLKKDLAKMDNDFKLKYQANQASYNETLKKYSSEMVKMQMGVGKGYFVPIGFKDGTAIEVPKAYYDEMLEYFVGDDWDGRTVTKDNVRTFIRNHPKEVNAFLNMFGLGAEGEAAEKTISAKVPFPLHISQAPEDVIKASAANNEEEEETDFSSFKRAK